VDAVERHGEEVFGLLRRRPMLSAAREIGGARHVGEGDNAAVVGADAELRCRLSGEPAIGLGMGGRPALG